MKKYNNVFDSCKLIEKIKKHKVISFDIFDTLIKRDCKEPIEVFELMEKNLGERFIGFANKRILAERKCLEISNGKEITLDDIYSNFQCEKNWDLEFLKEKEIETELQLCQKNKAMEALYEYAVEHCSAVILVTDMYLPRNIIEEILSKTKIKGYKRIFISSEVGKTKRTGELYKIVINELYKDGIIAKAHDIIHIGDNFKSDYMRPKQFGIRSIHIPKNSYNTFILYPGKPLTDVQKKEYLTLISYISNHECVNNTWFERIGYESLGPVLYGFSMWIKRQVDQERIDKIFFLSRDGQLMKRAYEYMNSEQRELCYMYGSRRALIVPTLWACKTIDEMFESMFMPRVSTLNAVISKLGLDELAYESLAQKYGLRYNVFYEYDSFKKEEKFVNFFESIKKDIINNSINEYHKVVQYLKSIEFRGKVALVDIGWHGNMQKALKKICQLADIDVTILGLYIGIKPYGTDACSEEHKICQNEIWARGYLFSPEYNHFLFNYQKNFTHIFEMMFAADHGSVKCFNNEMKPVFCEFEYDVNGNSDVKCSYEAIKDIQNGALCFVEELCNNPYCQKNWASITGFQNLLVLGNFPNMQVTDKFGELLVMDDEIRKIVTTHKLSDYLKTLSLLLDDYNASYWKIGYLKKILGVNVPYYLLRNIMDQWKGARRREK